MGFLWRTFKGGLLRVGFKGWVFKGGLLRVGI